MINPIIMKKQNNSFKPAKPLLVSLLVLISGAMLFPQTTVHLSVNTDKCLDLSHGNAANFTNVQLWNCLNNSAQKWKFDDTRILLAANQNYCLDLKDNKTNNGTNIQLYGCSGWDNQKWVYDGLKKNIRTFKDLAKCVDLSKGNTSNGANIQIWDCQEGNTNQIWDIPNTETVELPIKVGSIRSYLHQDKCLDNKDGSTRNGNNIQLWTCGGTNGMGTDDQLWYFDGTQIKLNSDRHQCLDLMESKTHNGNNIIQYFCNGTDAQVWIYDGVTRNIRSGVDPTKCIDISAGKTADGTNIQIWECQPGNTNQQFLIQPDDPCRNNNEPPVAKCKAVTFVETGSSASVSIDDGSYDDCSPIITNQMQVAGDLYRLTVSDASGNSSSCTGWILPSESIVAVASDEFTPDVPANVVVFGNAGDDILHGGSGLSFLNGNAGNDQILGSSQTGYFSGGAGNDLLQGGQSRDVLLGGGGDDVLIGNEENDQLYGDLGNHLYFSLWNTSNWQYTYESNPSSPNYGNLSIKKDNITYGPQDLLYSYNPNFDRPSVGGHDNLQPGNDDLQGGPGDDSLDGGDGEDTANYRHAASGIVVDLSKNKAFNDGDGGEDVLTNMENVDGSEYDDEIIGDDGANKLYGRAGADLIDGGAGDDVLSGGPGNDIFSFGSGDGDNNSIVDFEPGDIIDLGQFSLPEGGVSESIEDGNKVLTIVDEVKVRLINYTGPVNYRYIFLEVKE